MTPDKTPLPSNNHFLPPLEDLVSARSESNDDLSLADIVNFPISLINDRLRNLSDFLMNSSANSSLQATSNEISLPQNSLQRLLIPIRSQNSALFQVQSLRGLSPTIIRIVSTALQDGNLRSALMATRFILDGSVTFDFREVRLARSQRYLAITAPFLRAPLPSPNSENLPKTPYELAKACVERFKKIVYQSDHNEEEESCPICLGSWEKSETISVLPCNHHFHVDCIVTWFTNNMSCPNCRCEMN